MYIASRVFLVHMQIVSQVFFIILNVCFHLCIYIFLLILSHLGLSTHYSNIDINKNIDFLNFVFILMFYIIYLLLFKSFIFLSINLLIIIINI